MRPFSHHRIAVAVTVLVAVAVAAQLPAGQRVQAPLDSDRRADPGRQPTRAGPERRRRAARDLEPRQLADVDLRDSALPGREGGRNLDGRDGVAGEQRPRPRCHARQDVEALRAGSRRHQHVHRSGDRGTLDVAERRLVGRRRRRVRVRDRGHRGEGRSAGDRVARKRGGGSPARIDPAGLRAWDDRVVPRDGRGQRRDRALRGHECRPGRRLCSASSTQPRSSRRPAALGKEWGNGLSGRIGAAGVYVAYADGKAARLYRYGGRSRTLARGAYSSATLCAGPGGRLWIAWGDNAGNVSVTRSNRAASVLEPVQRLKLPAGALTFLQCEGSMGPADLFASAQLGGGFWHAHVPAQLSLSAQATRTKVTISARDAGDPVAGATIKVGGKQLRTATNGRVSLTLRPGSYSASATAAGYSPPRLGSRCGEPMCEGDPART